MKKTSIKRKISAVVLGIAFVSLTVFCGAALWGLHSVRAQMRLSSELLGEFAAEKSSDFLEREALGKLMNKARDRAALINERLGIIAKDIVYFSDYASDLYRNAHILSPVPVQYSSSANNGVLTMQLRSANGEDDFPRIMKEVGLLGNLTSAYTSNASDMDVMTVALFIGTESGIFISFERFSDDDTREFDPRWRPWYTGAKKRGGTYWTAPYTDASSGSYIVTCARPVYGPGGEFKGVTGIDVVIEDLDTEIANIGIGEQGYAFIVDREGTLISSKELDRNEEGVYKTRSAYRSGVNIEFNTVIMRMTRGETGFERVATDQGSKYMAFAPILATGWSVAIVQPVSEIMGLVEENSAAIEKMTGDTLGFVNSVITLMAFLFVVMFAVAAIVIVYAAGELSEKITRPIVTLEDCLRRIAGGELDTRIELKTGDEIERLGYSVNAMALELKDYIANLQSVTAEKERIGAELDVARKIQASMLPCTFPPFPERGEFDIYASMQSAREVGGDFYDFFFVDENTLAVVMADVSGKGVPAALFMVIARTLIKNGALSGGSPGEVFDTVNNTLCENNRAGMFVTAFMGCLDVRNGKFTYANAGHTPGILCSNGRCGYIRANPCFVLGGAEDMEFEQGEIALRGGDALFLYTDGVTEAANGENGMFGDRRLIDAVNRYAGLPVSEFSLSIKNEIGNFAGGAEQSDDITMLALKYHGPGGAGHVQNVAAELAVDAKLENLAAVQDFIAEKLEALDCPAKLLTQISVAVEEIFVNIASYAYGPEAGGATVRVSAAGEPGDCPQTPEVTIEFEDGGKPYNPLEKRDPDVTLSAEDREIGGLGIFMVKRIMDAVDYRREGNRNILTLRKKLEP